MAVLRLLANLPSRFVRSLYGLLTLACLIYWVPLLMNLDQWGRGDWDQFSFRYATARAAMLRDGQLPLWNPYVNGGNVLLAHPHCPAFSPWAIPALVLGVPLGLRVEVLLFLILGTTGMAALLRRLGVSAAGCFTGAIVLMMSAHFALHIAEGHVEWCALGLMPWVVLCLIRARRDWRFILLAAALLASALLHGSIYILAVFAPAIVLWAILEGVRRRTWRDPAVAAAALALAALLAAVVFLPRMEFVAAQPRAINHSDGVSPAALPAMLLDPRQAAMFRSTQEFRNPPDDEVARLAALPRVQTESELTWRWRRLDLRLTTTSDWTDVQISGAPYVLWIGPPDDRDRTTVELDAARLSTEGLALSNPGARPLSAGGKSPAAAPANSSGAALSATLYVRRAGGNGVRFTIKRGDVGATRLIVRCGDAVFLDALNDRNEPGAAGNARTFLVPRAKLDVGDRLAGAWCSVEVTLRTTSDWCSVDVADRPYLFQLEDPEIERRKPLPLSARPLEAHSPRPAKEAVSLRAILCVQFPAKGDVRLLVAQGAKGRSRLSFRSVGGELIPAKRNELAATQRARNLEYVLAKPIISQHCPPQPTPWRWELDAMGMTYGWHEYACYATWLGLAMAVIGLAARFDRHWPLIATGAAAGLVALGATLPLDLWRWMQQFPFYRSLQAPSRFLAVVVFVLAVCAGLGVERMGRRLRSIGGARFRFGVEWLVAAAIYIELTVLGWGVFADVFVCPPRMIHKFPTFAQRYAEDSARYSVMYSALWPYMRDNSGVLREYENIAIPPGNVRLVGQRGYRGEAYLQARRGEATIASWSMARVKVGLTVRAPDRLALNENYWPGWKAVRRGGDGRAERLPAERNADGLVSLPVRPGDAEVEFYYLPDSFLWGSGVSAATVAACLGLLLVGRGRRRRRATAPPPGQGAGEAPTRDPQEGAPLPQESVPLLARQAVPTRKDGHCFWTGTDRRLVVAHPRAAAAARWIAWGGALNLPFALCHPAWTLAGAPLVRSLAINAVLFLAPGLPLAAILVRRLPGLDLVSRRLFELLWAMVASMLVFVCLLLAMRWLNRPPQPAVIWNATWVVANLGLLAQWAAWRRGKADSPPPIARDAAPAQGLLAILIFAVAYTAFFLGATRVVPPMDDHDSEVLACGYGLLTRQAPLLVSDREVPYQFAHPPWAHFLVAGSFLYFDRLDYLAYYDAASQRTLAAQLGQPFTAFAGTVDGLTNGAGRHRVVGIRGKDYVIDPPLTDGARRVSVWLVENAVVTEYYRQNPQRLAARTPNIFLSALTVALIGWWAARATGRRWFGLLAAMVYAAGPETFVRSSYGGYFAIDQFAVLALLAAAAAWPRRRHWTVWATCLMAGVFAALADHKLILLPAAVVLWELVRSGPRWNFARVAGAAFHPAALGFAAGTAMFWAYGMAIDPVTFWQDHVHTHFIDRIIHHNPLGYLGYPTAGGFWLELWQHTGYALLPLGLAGLAFGWRRQDDAAAMQPREAFGATGLWTIWFLLVAIAFSLIDWRQTKHLMPLLVPMILAPSQWAAVSRAGLLIVSLALAGLAAWNFQALRLLASDFASFAITPAW